MDQSKTPVPDALASCHAVGQTPSHRQATSRGRGADPQVRAVLGGDVFRSDVLAANDDRTSSRGVVEEAQGLVADAAGADHAFFSTCGSSLSAKAAMQSVTGPHEKLPVGRDARTSVVSGLVPSGVRPVRVGPQWDAERHLAPEDLLGTTSPSALVHAALDGMRVHDREDFCGARQGHRPGPAPDQHRHQRLAGDRLQRGRPATHPCPPGVQRVLHSALDAHIDTDPAEAALRVMERNVSALLCTSDVITFSDGTAADGERAPRCRRDGARFGKRRYVRTIHRVHAYGEGYM